MAHPLDVAAANPWSALRQVVGEPLHPGGAAATETLLDRAEVGPGTRLLDLGCGAGQAVSLAQDRGARAVGLDRHPTTSGMLQGDLQALPVATGSIDVLLAECVLCLADDLDRAVEESARVLAPAGRLALSDVVVRGELPDLPPPIERALCLEAPQSEDALVGALERNGLAVRSVTDHQAALLEMRDRAADRVDYERLLPAFGDRGRELLAGIERLEAAIEAGTVGYVSLIAGPTP